jgi:hypothetical protein
MPRLRDQLVADEDGRQTEEDVGRDVGEVLARAPAPTRRGRPEERDNDVGAEEPDGGADEEPAAAGAVTPRPRQRAVRCPDGGRVAVVEELVKEVVRDRTAVRGGVEARQERLFHRLRRAALEEAQSVPDGADEVHAAGARQPTERAMDDGLPS